MLGKGEEKGRQIMKGLVGRRAHAHNLCAWSQAHILYASTCVLGPSCTWWQAHTHLEIRAEHKRAAILVALSTR